MPVGLMSPGADVRARGAPPHARVRHAERALRDDLGRVLRQRAAQPARGDVRAAAHARGTPALAHDRRSLSPVRLLPGERRGVRGRGHEHRARARPAPAAGADRGRRRGARRRRRRRPVPPPAGAVDLGRARGRGARSVRARRRRADGHRRRAALRELHRPGAHDDRGLRVLREGRGRPVRRGRHARVAARRPADQHRGRQSRRGVHPRPEPRERGRAPAARRVDVARWRARSTASSWPVHRHRPRAR